jgi:hypothetical protein
MPPVAAFPVKLSGGAMVPKSGYDRTGAQDKGLSIQASYGSQFQVTGQPSAVSLSVQQSGQQFVFDRAAGTTFTLPAPPPVANGESIYFDFFVKTTASGGNYKVITNAATVFLMGSLINIDTDSSNAVAAWTADGTTIRAITMNGGTTGGLLGTWFRIASISPTQWMVFGIDQGSGVVATPFATS